jgi:hypothetical protein
MNTEPGTGENSTIPDSNDFFAMVPGNNAQGNPESEGKSLFLAFDNVLYIVNVRIQENFPLGGHLGPPAGLKTTVH